MFGTVPVEELRDWSPSARSQRLLELLEQLERLHAEIVKTAGEWDAQGDWAVDGAVSPRAWLAHRTPVTRHRASRLVAQARLCRQHEATSAALEDGTLSSAHLDVLAPMIRGREPEYARCEVELLEAASTLRADDFAVVAHHWREAADDELAQLDAAAMADRVALHVSKTIGGTGVLTGDLDADGTATLLEALDLAAPPDSGAGPEPPRSLAQRRAHGLIDICAAFIARKGKGGRAGVGLNVTMDHETAAGHMPMDPRDIRCELSRVGPIALVTAQRLACDCLIGRVVMDGTSENLDLGRRQRTPDRALRRALEIRDRHCVWPGCDRPVEWCDAHHIVWWERGGPTNLENCLLLCRQHHVLCHEGGWTITRKDGKVEVEPPTAGFVPTRRRRSRWRAPPLAA
jgi:hypothetical protein